MKKLIKSIFSISLVGAIFCANLIYAEDDKTLMNNDAPAVIYSEDRSLSNDSIEFLKKHNIELQDVVPVETKDTEVIHSDSIKKTVPYVQSYDDIILSIANEAEAYDFSDEQIEKLIRSTLNAKPKFIVPDDTVSVNSVSDDYSQNRDPLKDDGVGYEVYALSGYYETTAFATLPRVNLGRNNNAAYMFWTVNDKIDIGLVYSSGTYGNKWRMCWLYAGKEMQVAPADEDNARLQELSNIYFKVTVIDNNWIKMDILNAADFDELVMTYSVNTTGYSITRSNAQWNRQISLCTGKKVNDIPVFDDGAYLINAKFENAYIYGSAIRQVLPAYVNGNRCGIFGVDDTSAEYVEINSNTHWHSENITIRFPR